MKIKSRDIILNFVIKYMFVSSVVVAFLMVWVMCVFFLVYWGCGNGS